MKNCLITCRIDDAKPIFKVGLDVLKTALSKNDAKETVHLLQKLVVGFQPSEKITDWVYVEQEKLIENKKIQEFEAKH